MDIQNRYAPADQEMAKGSAPITMKFLRQFYLDAYDRIVPICQKISTL